MSKPAYKVGKLPRHIWLHFLWSFHDLIYIKLTKQIIVKCWQHKIVGYISKNLSTKFNRKLLLKQGRCTKKRLSSRFLTNFTLRSLITTALHEMETIIKSYCIIFFRQVTALTQIPRWTCCSSIRKFHNIILIYDFFVKLLHSRKFLIKLVAIWRENFVT